MLARRGSAPNGILALVRDFGGGGPRMSFEGIVCPDCGASAGITQVEPDTFYCSHHKGLFKYVDPSRIKVQVEGSFCSCGNRVEFRCQPCNEGLCAECDAIEWQMGARTPSDHPMRRPSRDPRKLVIPLQSFGYLVIRKPNVFEPTLAVSAGYGKMIDCAI